MLATRLRRSPEALLGIAAIVAITAGGLALRMIGLDAVRPNWFYDAAVRSMGRSWHNFFYAAFDPAGRLAVDKPPVELWLQVASVKLFGWGQVSLKLPEALMGAAAVPLLYDMLRRLFGRGAGLAGAAALAVLPVAVLTARSSTMDTTATTLALLAAWLVLRACERRRPVFLWLAALVIGLAFNVKLFEALLPVPALALLYWLGMRVPWRRRALHLAATGAALAVVSLAWIAATSLAPAHARPFPIGSVDGTTWSAAFVHNGAARSGSFGGGRGTFPGIAHLVGRHSQGRGVGIELVPTLLLGALGLAGVALRRRGGAAAGAVPVAGGQAVARSHPLALAGALAFGLWLLVDLFVFARLPNADPRYMAMLGPPVAGCLGISVAEVARRRHSVPWRIALAAALGAVALYAASIAPNHPVARGVGVAAGAVAVVLALAAGRHRLLLPGAAVAVCAAILAVPFALSAETVRAGASDASRLPALPGPQLAAFLRYAKAHRGGPSSVVAVYNPTVLAAAIARGTGPILPLSSWQGRPLVRLAELRTRTAAGQVRVALLGNTRCDAPPPAHPAHCLPTVSWIAAHGRDISASVGLKPPFALYRLSPRSGRAPTPTGTEEVVSPARRGHRLG